MQKAYHWRIFTPANNQTIWPLQWWIIAPAVSLQTVLCEFELPPLPVHVVHQEGRMVSAKVRSFVDYMVERLRADPAIN